MRTFLASALCTILITATGFGQSQTISATGHVVVEFEPDWARLQIPVIIKGDYQSEAVKRRLDERCDLISAVIRRVCDTSVSIWYSEAQTWTVAKGRKYRIRGITRDIHLVLRDLGSLAALENQLKDDDVARPNVSQVGLHSDTAAMKFVIATAAEHARVQAEAAAAPVGVKLGAVTELKANPPTRDPSFSSCGMSSQEERVLRYYGYDRPPLIPVHVPKVRMRGYVSVVWSIG